MVEALAQLAGVATVDEQDQGGFLAAIDHAEFMHPPKPGDTLILSVKIQKSFGRLFLLDGEVCADGRKLLVASLTLGVGKL
jgi:3-hydroxyacyl-[acyl-carrier-protein] dehydratase